MVVGDADSRTRLRAYERLRLAARLRPGQGVGFGGRRIGKAQLVATRLTASEDRINFFIAAQAPREHPSGEVSVGARNVQPIRARALVADAMSGARRGSTKRAHMLNDSSFSNRYSAKAFTAALLAV